MDFELVCENCEFLSYDENNRMFCDNKQCKCSDLSECPEGKQVWYATFTAVARESVIAKSADEAENIARNLKLELDDFDIDFDYVEEG